MTEELALVKNKPDFMIRFDPIEHRYFYGDRPVPGFSQIIKDLGFPTNPFWTLGGRDEGTALSVWCLFLAQGQEPADPPDDRIAGRVEGFRRFMAECSFEFVGGEEPQYCPIPEYMCKPDLWGKLNSINSVVEVKRGAAMGIHKLQTAAQALALMAGGFSVVRRFCLYLKDGGYSLVPHKDRSDYQYWKSCVEAYHAKHTYGEGK